MDYTQDKDQAKTYSKAAMKRIVSEDLPPTPPIYELWFVYYASLSPDVNAALDAIADKGEKITSVECMAVYDQFLDSQKREESVRIVGDRMHGTLKDIAKVISGVQSATSDYSGTLEGISGSLSEEEAMENLNELITSLIDETKHMAEHNQSLERQLDQSSTIMEELQKDLDSVRKEAMTDGLTGLVNRKAFDNELERIAEKAQEDDIRFTLLMIDIDHFKSFNDNYGHQVGDQVLRLVAKTLTDGVKGRDTAARYGGEEFAIILPDTDLSSSVKVADSLRRAVESKDIINRSTGDTLGRITMSVGASEYIPGEDLKDLIERADTALYTAKHNGRNQVAAAPRSNDKKETKAAS